MDKEPLHIVHVVRQFWPSTGGLEDFVERISAQQIALGHRVSIVTCNSVFADANKQILPEFELHEDREIFRVPWRFSTKYPIAPQAIVHLKNADLVHVHAIDFFFDFLAITKIWHKKPMVVTTHGGFFHTQDLALLKKVWFQTLTRFSASFYHRIIGCSQNDKRNFDAIAARKTIAIDNGVNIDKFAGASSQKLLKNIITLGRFSKNKRLDNLINTMAELDEDWRLDIVGAPSDWSAEDIRKMIDECGVSSRVQLHVKPSDEEISSLMSRCSFFASASEFEGFGLAAVEAMSAGLVPVLHNNPTFEDLAQLHPPICLTDFANPSLAATAFADAFQRAEAQDLRTEMIDRVQAYSWDAVCEKYLTVYRDVLSTI